MKQIIVIACVFILALGIFASIAPSQESPLDLGETNLLQLACDYSRDNIEPAGVLNYCRRYKPEVFEGSKATAKIAVKVDGRKFLIQINFRKSLYWPVSVKLIG